VHLQDRHRIRILSERSAVNYVVFDLLYLRGKSAMADSLWNRRAMLRQMLSTLRVPGVALTEHVPGSGCELYRAVIALGLEGVMAKRLDSPYLPGKRSRAWIKVKPAAAQANDGGNGNYGFGMAQT